jgi:broad specificity phosphatase PhoE
LELYIIRHAQSTNNALNDPQGRSYDPPLTEMGRHQAQVLARHLANGTNQVPKENKSYPGPGYGITRLYCSPMWRALQTAQPIGLALELAPEVWVDVHEYGGIYLDHGEDGGVVGYPGKTRSEILAEFPDYVLPEKITEQGWWNRGREDWPTCHQRALKAAQQLRQMAASDERVAMISHGGFIDTLLKALFNLSPDRQIWCYQYNTAVSRIDFPADGSVEVHYLNRLDHLPAELVS